MSYLLEAKKKAEKDYAKQQEKERKEARQRAKDDAKKQKKGPKKDAKRSTSADDAVKALEEAQVREALRKSKAEQDAKDRKRRDEEASRERARLAEIKKTRDALNSSEYDYEDSADLGVVIQSSAPKQNIHFRAVGGHQGGKQKRMSLSVSADDVWTDMSINCTYVGTFEVGTEVKVNKTEVKSGIHAMKDYLQNERAATLIVCLEGVKVIDTTSDKVAMAHALSRVSMAAADSKLPLFGFVAKNPGTPQKYCHVFNMKSKAHADHLQGLVMKAFRLAFANEKAHEIKAKAVKAANAPRLNQAPPLAQPHVVPQQQHPRDDVRPMGNRQWAKHNPLPAISHDPRARAPPRATPQHAQQHRSKPPAGRGQPPRVSSNPSRGPSGNAPELGKKPPPPPVTEPPRPSAPPAAKQDENDDDCDANLDDATWFQAGIPREIAMELLEMSDDGAFVVRDSSSQPGNYALTMKGDGLMNHFIVRKIPQGHVLGSESQGQTAFPNLTSLIMNYTTVAGCLPCCLQLDSTNKIYNDNNDNNDNEGEHSFIDPDYQDLVELMGGLTGGRK